MQIEKGKKKELRSLMSGGNNTNTKCHANFAGSSGSMDSAGMLAIFERSLQQHNTRYVEFLGDGDSKAHNLLIQENVYGDVDISKT